MGQREPFILYHDATGAWYAAPPGFQSILRDPLGRGESRSEAIRDLCTHPEFIHRARLGEWPPCPEPRTFVECVRGDILVAALTNVLETANRRARQRATDLSGTIAPSARTSVSNQHFN
jgi:hypothetical protein